MRASSYYDFFFRICLLLGTTSPNPFDMSEMGSELSSGTGARPKKTVQSILGEHPNLVNLDDLVSGTSSGITKEEKICLILQHCFKKYVENWQLASLSLLISNHR